MQDFNIERFEIEECFYLSSGVNLIIGTFINNNTNVIFPFNAELWKNSTKYNELTIASYRLVSNKRFHSENNYYVFETTNSLITITDNDTDWYLLCYLPIGNSVH